MCENRKYCIVIWTQLRSVLRLSLPVSNKSLFLVGIVGFGGPSTIVLCRSSWSRCWKTPPQRDAATACFAVGMVLGRQWAEFCFLQTWCLESSLSWVLKLEDPVFHSPFRCFTVFSGGKGSWRLLPGLIKWPALGRFLVVPKLSEFWMTLWSGEPSQIYASVEAFLWALEFILSTSWHTDRYLN